MNGYHLFSGEKCYPHGGADDWDGAFSTLAEAQSAYEPPEDEDGWAHVALVSPAGVRVVARVVPYTGNVWAPVEVER